MPRKILTPEERTARKKAAWHKILEGQRRPGSTPGTPDEWVRTFQARFGISFGAPAVPTLDAYSYFGLTRGATAAEVKQAFVRRISEVHPDHGGTVEAARECIENYEALQAATKAA